MDLLQQVAVHRDIDAFRQLFQSYAPRVKSYMMRQGADPNMPRSWRRKRF